jgi:hypothetical protein
MVINKIEEVELNDLEDRLEFCLCGNPAGGDGNGSGSDDGNNGGISEC